MTSQFNWWFYVITLWNRLFFTRLKNFMSSKFHMFCKERSKESKIYKKLHCSIITCLSLKTVKQQIC